MIELKKICKSYKPKKGKSVNALNDVSLFFEEKGIIFILGKSGSGKSTLLNIIGGLDTYDSGEMIVDGISTKLFKEKDYDFYRNNYVGFIFQDYNIIEDYTAYENILLAIELQNKKVVLNETNMLLSKLEIEELKHRKVSELSGGQKQRIAIARALIKEPKIILADEPTGNLDSITGEQVMCLLKEISKEKLVIVVSHNEDMAKKFADYTIKIKDGHVEKEDKQANQKYTLNGYKIGKNKLPFKHSFKLGIISLLSKKVKLIFTTILIAFSAMFLGIAYNIKTYDVIDNHVKLLDENHVEMLEIKKIMYNSDYSNNIQQPRYLLNDDRLKICNNLKNECIFQYYLDDYGNIVDFLKLNIDQSDELLSIYNREEFDLYTRLPGLLEIVEVNPIEKLINENIIGSEPKANDEIIISNYLADMIIKIGLYDYDNNELFLPKNYDEIVNSNKKIYFGSYNYAKIVGIINYDLSKYQILKELPSRDSKISGSVNLLKNELNNLANKFYNKVYVKPGFINNLKNDNFLRVDSNNKFSIELDNNKVNATFNIINHDVLYYDGNKWTTTNKLQKNEIIIELSTILDENAKYMEKLNEYIKKYPYKDKLELEKEFVLKFINPSNYIGKFVTINVYEYAPIYLNIINKIPDNSYDNIKIIGITGLIYNDNIYSNTVSKELLSNYISTYVKNNAIIVKEKNSIELRKILEKFPFGDKYSATSLYSDNVKYYNMQLKYIEPFVDYSIIVFSAFGVLLIANFMFSSISARKKDIGILKSLGAKNNDILKLFIVEIFILSLLSTIVSLIFLSIIFNLLNETIMSTSDLLISPFYLTFKVTCFMFISISTIIFVSSIIPLFKISKLKPINAIYNK